MNATVMENLVQYKDKQETKIIIVNVNLALMGRQNVAANVTLLAKMDKEMRIVSALAYQIAPNQDLIHTAEQMVANLEILHIKTALVLQI
jgi:hypothetical protein